ncbi:MAG: UTP--glucose-1-phosphate uridylyltransferase [Propionibacteriaceae bacterium]|nr:UTP--glucose-1-phosphate uridylyltransferase [Propionibacteriaceae bacterium]
MSDAGLAAAVAKMRGADVEPTAIASFVRFYNMLEQGGSGTISEDAIAPLTDVPSLHSLAAHADSQAAAEAIRRTVVVKLNGGLGTSMGLDGPKTLLQAREGHTFLEIILLQVEAARARYDARLPLVFMNSFRTRADTLEFLSAHGFLSGGNAPSDFLQSAEPKLFVDTLEPAKWPSDPELEWCPPGHGEVYSALSSAGLIDSWLRDGFEHVFISNSDNLGASPSAELAGAFAASGAPFAMEVARRTTNDRKGGHVATRIADGRLVLRESAQTAPEDLEAFADETKHAYFNTNSLWLRLDALRDVLQATDGTLELPLIRNQKPVDPSDPTTPQVYQLECAMGAAIELFDDSIAIDVGRKRFMPVKTTNELLLLRSDCYELNPDDWTLTQLCPRLPEVHLDERYYKLVTDFDARFQSIPPLAGRDTFTVEGDQYFTA